MFTNLNRADYGVNSTFAMSQDEGDSQISRPFTPVLLLLAMCLLINYVDRGNLSIAAPLLKDELGISELF